MEEFTVRPDPDDPRLTRRVDGIDQEGRAIETAVVTERPLTLFLNGREIVTMMTLGDHPDDLAAGAIHGCVLCEEDRPLLYMEDVGRHNAVDKIAGYMHLKRISPAGKIFYTTGRLTSEMVIKTVQMGIPILISRSGFTAWGVDLARQAGLTLIGRAKGRRFVALAGAERIVFDGDLRSVEDEHPRLARKASVEEDAA